MLHALNIISSSFIIQTCSILGKKTISFSKDTAFLNFIVQGLATEAFIDIAYIYAYSLFL